MGVNRCEENMPGDFYPWMDSGPKIENPIKIIFDDSRRISEWANGNLSSWKRLSIKVGFSVRF